MSCAGIHHRNADVRYAIASDMLKQQYRLSVQVHDWPISTELDKWMAEISRIARLQNVG